MVFQGAGQLVFANTRQGLYSTQARAIQHTDNGYTAHRQRWIVCAKQVENRCKTGAKKFFFHQRRFWDLKKTDYEFRYLPAACLSGVKQNKHTRITHTRARAIHILPAFDVI